MPKMVLDIWHGERGIDLSKWKSKYNLWGVIVKCGGSDDPRLGRFEETTWIEQVQQAHALGLHVGAYYYSDATDAVMALADAKHCVNECMRGMTIDMPIYLDIEERSQLDLPMWQLTEVVTTFCNYVRSAGYEVGIYSGYEGFHNMHEDEISSYSLWVAAWRTSWPIWAADYDLWQEGSIDYAGVHYHDNHTVDLPGHIDLDWASDAFVAKIEQGGGEVPKNLFNPAEEMAELHAWMCTNPAFGYNIDSPGGNNPTGMQSYTTKSGRTYHIMGGDYSCSTSIITVTKVVFARTKYAHAFDAATYTGDMRAAYVSSGLWAAVWQAAVRGDIYLAEGKHTALCQDGGSDGVFGYDCLSEFNRSEDPNDRYHGKSGDQDGYESVIREYYDDNWNVILHYVGGLIEDLMWDGDEGAETVGGMPMLYDGSDGRVYYWTGDPESVPYHVNGDELAAIQTATGLKLKKLDQKTATTIMSMCKARKAWREQGIAEAVAAAEKGE